MLAEFSYLGSKDAKRVVIDNPLAIAATACRPNCASSWSTPEGAETFQPYWDFAEKPTSAR